jgi:hypothetical protein
MPSLERGCPIDAKATTALGAAMNSGLWVFRLK